MPSSRPVRGLAGRSGQPGSSRAGQVGQAGSGNAYFVAQLLAKPMCRVKCARYEHTSLECGARKHGHLCYDNTALPDPWAERRGLSAPERSPDFAPSDPPGSVPPPAGRCGPKSERGTNERVLRRSRKTGPPARTGGAADGAARRRRGGRSYPASETRRRKKSPPPFWLCAARHKTDVSRCVSLMIPRHRCCCCSGVVVRPLADLKGRFPVCEWWVADVFGNPGGQSEAMLELDGVCVRVGQGDELR